MDSKFERGEEDFTRILKGRREKKETSERGKENFARIGKEFS